MGKAAYDEFANWYDENLASGPRAFFHELAISAVSDLAGDVTGKTACDLACGQGIVGRYLADRGADVVGIDISPKLLEIARRYECTGTGSISYICDDAENLAGIEDESFEIVVCNLALMDMAEPEKVFRTVHRILRADGCFVFSIIHPCFLTPGSSRWIQEKGQIVGMDVRRYFEEGYWRKEDTNEGIRGRVGSYHWTLGSYINILSRSGLVVSQVSEPRATGVIAEKLPGYHEVPGVLAVRCGKSK